MLQLRPSSTLDGGDFGWLKAKHHFAVRPDGNPANGPLGALMVWNDDEIAPGTGFVLQACQTVSTPYPFALTERCLERHSSPAGNFNTTLATSTPLISYPHEALLK
jgi:hypothetical protein